MEDKLDKMIGHDVIALVVGIGIGLLVNIVMQILIAVLSSKTSGIVRSIFLGAGRRSAIRPGPLEER